MQYKFRFGLSWLDAHSERLYWKPFIELEPGQQNLILRHLAYKKEFRDGEEDGRVFFELIREYTVMGFLYLARWSGRAGLSRVEILFGIAELVLMWTIANTCICRRRNIETRRNEDSATWRNKFTM